MYFRSSSKASAEHPEMLKGENKESQKWRAKSRSSGHEFSKKSEILLLEYKTKILFFWLTM